MRAEAGTISPMIGLVRLILSQLIIYKGCNMGEGTRGHVITQMILIGG